MFFVFFVLRQRRAGGGGGGAGAQEEKEKEKGQDQKEIQVSGSDCVSLFFSFVQGGASVFHNKQLTVFDKDYCGYFGLVFLSCVYMSRRLVAWWLPHALACSLQERKNS